MITRAYSTQFLFLDDIKENICTTIPTNILDLQQHIFNAGNTVAPVMLMNGDEKMFLPFQICILANGALFKNIQH